MGLPQGKTLHVTNIHVHVYTCSCHMYTHDIVHILYVQTGYTFHSLIPVIPYAHSWRISLYPMTSQRPSTPDWLPRLHSLTWTVWPHHTTPCTQCVTCTCIYTMYMYMYMSCNLYSTVCMPTCATCTCIYNVHFI